MRSSIIRLAVVAGCVAAVLSCDAGPITPVFGNGIAGGATGTAPIPPLNPSAPDTEPPFVVFCGVNVLVTTPCSTPTAQGQQVNVGDSILIVVRGIDNRQLTNITIEGVKFVGDPNLGTLQEVKRFPPVASPALGASFPISATRPTPGGLLQDTLTRRFLLPAQPIDSSPGQVQLRAIASDNQGNVDTAFHTINVVLGPRVEVLAPVEADSVSQGSNMLVQVRVTHGVGVQGINLTVRGESSFPAVGALNASFTDPIVNGTCAACRAGSTARDLTIEHIVAIPDSAPVGGRITITASATDLSSNPGSAPPRIVFVREAGTTVPRVTQVVAPRLEVGDSITIIASGDNIDSVGFTVRDSTGAVIREVATIAYSNPANRASSARVNMVLNMPPRDQGKRVKISSFAVDTSSGLKGFSVETATSLAQANASLAFQDTAIIVFGKTYALPRAGTIGDLIVDTVVGRSRAIVSNMDNNRLDVWSNVSKTFDLNGVAVGSQPWGMNLMLHKDSLLVANSGGTNISRVFLGNPGGALATMQENLPARIRTRTNFIYTIGESFDAAGFIHFAEPLVTRYSDRPQYVGQVSDGIIFLSTKPTTELPRGTVRYINPGQQFPDMKTFAFSDGAPASNYNFLDVDSVVIRNAGLGRSDTVIIWDHLPGTLNPPDSVKGPTCAFPGPSTNPTVVTCASALDPRFDARFPDGLPQGPIPVINALYQHDPLCSPNCSDGTVIINANITGITDTTFIALSSDRHWIAFGSGNDNPGDLLMCNHDVTKPSYPFCSDNLSKFDLTGTANEQIFGLAIDSTGFIVGAHGVQTFFSAVEDPLHLRLQGVYGGQGTGGAGIAFHPRANGQVDFAAAPPVPRPDDERLAFIADGNKSIHAVDIAFFIRRGLYPLKHQLYGPLRVTRPLEGDNPVGTTANDLVVLKLYGISLAGGLTVIDLRRCDILLFNGGLPAGCP
jgi:hypothetical protein